ncbi:hypothetical protein ACU8YE_24820, partial [Ralstonia sp. VS2407]
MRKPAFLILAVALSAPALAWVPKLEETTARNVIDGAYGRRVDRREARVDAKTGRASHERHGRRAGGWLRARGRARRLAGRPDGNARGVRGDRCADHADHTKNARR